MARIMKEAGSLPPHTERRVISLSSFLERSGGRSRRLTHVAVAESHRIIMLAERAHQADQIEQAKSLIEAAYAIYDQCVRVSDDVGSHANIAKSSAPKSPATAVKEPDRRLPPLS